MIGTTRNGEGGRHTHDNIGRTLALATIFVAVIDHIGIGHIIAWRSWNRSQVVINEIRSRNSIDMCHTIGGGTDELPGDSVHRGGHVGECGSKANMTHIGAHRGVPHCNGRYRMRGHIHSYCHWHGSAHTDTIGWNNSIGQHHCRCVIVHQVLTVYGSLIGIRSSTAHIVTIRATSWILRRFRPGIGGAGRSGRRDHKGTAGTDVLRHGGNRNRQVVGQAHGKLGCL